MWCRLIRRPYRHTSMHKISTKHMVHNITRAMEKLMRRRPSHSFALSIPSARFGVQSLGMFRFYNAIDECIIESAGRFLPHRTPYDAFHFAIIIWSFQISVCTVTTHRDSVCAEHNLSIFISFVLVLGSPLSLSHTHPLAATTIHSGYAKIIYFWSHTRFPHSEMNAPVNDSGGARSLARTRRHGPIFD